MNISLSPPLGLRLLATLTTPLIVLLGCAGGDTPTAPTAGSDGPDLSRHADHANPAGPAVQGGGLFEANIESGWIYNISVSASVVPAAKLGARSSYGPARRPETRRFPSTSTGGP